MIDLEMDMFYCCKIENVTQRATRWVKKQKKQPQKN